MLCVGIKALVTTCLCWKKKTNVLSPGFVQSLEFLKFANQFSRPGKSLENKDKVWKNGRKSGEFFVLKTETSALLLSEFF